MRPYVHGQPVSGAPRRPLSVVPQRSAHLLIRRRLCGDVRSELHEDAHAASANVKRAKRSTMAKDAGTLQEDRQPASKSRTEDTPKGPAAAHSPT